jgi:hypothetical protein
MFINVSIDMLTKLVNTNTVECINQTMVEIINLAKYFNESVEKVANNYKTKQYPGFNIETLVVYYNIQKFHLNLLKYG